MNQNTAGIPPCFVYWGDYVKDKINQFLDRTTTVERTITACMVTFLATLVLVAGWLALLVGGWNNLLLTAKFGQILHVLERVYIGDVDLNAAADTAYNAMVDSLGDRWSMYLTAEQYDKYMQVQSNNYTGVGITIQQTDKGWLIAGVTDGSPAHKAGMEAGDYLVEVNGVRLTEESADEISAMIRTDPDHVVLVTADEEGQERTYELAMEEIYSNPVSYEMKDGQVGYIQLENFDDTCAKQTIAAIEDLIEQGAVGLVFDVRDNGGGHLKELTAILDYLLPEGEIFVSVDYEGNETVTRSDEAFVDLPMVVLVNENSYSAAEFFAAALREYDAAVIVGARTTGKNRSQTNALLIDGSAVHISSKQYLTPNRIDLTEQGGLTPDVEVPAGEGDSQLAAALAQFPWKTAKFH